jgi:hypothetical protein
MLRVLEEWINVALGLWLVASAWALETTTLAAELDFVVSGLLIALLALYEIWDARRPARHRA